ncbi:MAG: hypothetical protein ACXWCZ_05865 [Flavisolibacter sp.]
MKQFYLLCMVLLFSSLPIIGRAQDHWIPKNSVGAFAGLEWNTLSCVTGVSYERSLLKRDKLTLGLKATYVFNYENGTMEMFSDSFDGYTTIGSLMTTLHLFTSDRNQINEGFFLLFSAGGGSRNYKDEDYSNSSLVYCGELGLGWQFYLGKKTTFKLNTSMKFLGAGGITMMKLSFGF